MDPIFGFVVIVLAIWGARQGIPKAGSKINGARRNSLENWKQSHPNAPAIARWGASAGALGPAVRHGLPYLRDGLREAYREAKEEAEQKYINRPRPEPKRNQNSAGGGVKCPTCKKPLKPSSTHPGRFKPCDCQAKPTNGGRPATPTTTGGRPATPTSTGGRPATPTSTGGRAGQDTSVTPVQPGRKTTEAADKKNRDRADNSTDQPLNGDSTMANQTYIEVVDCFTLLAAMEEKQTDAVHEKQDAAADLKRATDDLTHMQRTEANLKNLGVPDDQLTEFIKLIEADMARVKAAEARVKAADAEVAAVEEAVAMANRHVGMAGVAVGPFYTKATVGAGR